MIDGFEQREMVTPCLVNARQDAAETGGANHRQRQYLSSAGKHYDHKQGGQNEQYG